MSTTVDGQALLQAILDDPADDLPRLAYADWLDENGDPDRAAFIRDQVLRLPGDNDIDLLDANLDAWFGWFGRHDELGFTRIVNDLKVVHASGEITHWTRGFVFRVRLSQASWLEHGKEIVRQHPLEHVELSDREPQCFLEIRHGSEHFSARWYEAIPGDSNSSYIHSDLMKQLLPGGFHGQHPGYPWWFWGREEALDALSAACLLFARQPTAAAGGISSP